MCMGNVSSSVFPLTVLLVANLTSRNGKTAKAPEGLIAADISSGFRFLWRGLFNFCFSCPLVFVLYFAFFLLCIRPFVFRLSLPFRVLCLCWSKAGSYASQPLGSDWALYCNPPVIYNRIFTVITSMSIWTFSFNHEDGRIFFLRSI